MSKKAMGRWIDTVYNSVGKFAHIETRDGVHREGKLSGLRTRTIQLNGETVELIEELELNGDPTDCVQFDRIHNLNIE